MEQKTLHSVDSGHFSLRKKYSTTIENFSSKSSLPPVYSMQFTLRTLFSKKIKRRLLRLIVDTSYLARTDPRLSQTFHSSEFTVRILHGSTFITKRSQTINDLGRKVTLVNSQVPYKPPPLLHKFTSYRSCSNPFENDCGCSGPSIRRAQPQWCVTPRLGYTNPSRTDALLS